MASGTTPGMSQEQMQNALWFFRTEDPSAWNYSILALSFVGLLLGLIILGRNVMANRKRKQGLQYTAAEVDLKPPGTEAKHAFLVLGDGAGPLKQDFILNKEQEAGDIMVQWKDGNITSLYRGAAEEDV